MLCLCRARSRPRPRDGRCDDGAPRTARLLSAALLLPLMSRGPAAPLLAALLLLAYAAALSALPSPPSWERLFRFARGVWQSAAPVRRLVKRVFRPLDRLEQSFLRMTNISFMVNQMMFFTVCDRLLLDDPRVAGLYSLMFYNVTAYCVSYIKELIHKEDWSPYVTITEHSNVKHLAMSATKIVLEWTKAVTFIITVVFMLLVFGLEQGLQHYKPTFTYTAITALFYMCTEKVFAESFAPLLLWLQPPALEGLEALWAPVLLRAASMAMSGVAATALLWQQPLLWRAPAGALYFNVWLRGRETLANSYRALSAERAAVARFRFATEEELQEYEDVCAVCLSPMKRARVTPCQHLFHGDCLRQCLQRSDHCPICKRELRFY